MTNAVNIHWIATPGGERLAIAARPRGGEWLADEIAAWKRDGVDAVVSLLDQNEVRELGLGEEAALCHANGVAFVSFPVADRGIPDSTVAARQLAGRIATMLGSGQGVLIHCRIGIGRSAMIAALTLMRCGLDVSKAFTAIGEARGVSVPDTEEQRAWVERAIASRD